MHRLFTIIFTITLALTSACTPINGPQDRASFQQAYNNRAGSTLDGSLWNDMRFGFAIDHYVDEPEVQAQIDWYRSHAGYLYHILAQGAPYVYYIYQQTQSHNLPAELALLPIVESEYNPFAISRVGAVGLWQMMPGTASGFGLKIDWWYDGRRDIIASTNAALNYIAYLHDFLDDNWFLAIAAYDSGEGTVHSAVKRNLHAHRSTDFWSLHLPRETRTYVPKLLALAAIINDPSRYGVVLPPINDAPFLEQVNVGSQIDLAAAAKLAGISVKQLREYNPGFRRWATDPDGPFTLLMPVDKVDLFKANLASLPKTKRVVWHHYYVQHGNSLSEIARKYHTSVEVLREVNGLKGNTIHAQQSLLVPNAFHGAIKKRFLKERVTIAEDKLPGPHRVDYTVQHGDNLWNLSARFHLKVRQLRFWNNLTSEHRLSPGDQVVIWLPAHSHYYHRITTVRYRVKKGDSLIHIAKRYHTSVNGIRLYNKLSGNTVHTGKVLEIPLLHIVEHKKPTPEKQHWWSHIAHHNSNNKKAKHYIIHYQVKKGDAIYNIATRYHVSTHKLVQWNHLKNSTMIHPGQALVIYR